MTESIKDTQALKDAVVEAAFALVDDDTGDQRVIERLLVTVTALRTSHPAPIPETAEPRCEPPEWARKYGWHGIDIAAPAEWVDGEWYFAGQYEPDSPELCASDGRVWHSVATPSRTAPTDEEIDELWATVCSSNLQATSELRYALVKAALARFSATPATEGEA